MRNAMDEAATERTAMEGLIREAAQLDEALLSVFEKRLALAARIGRSKGVDLDPRTNLRPDREGAVLDRVLARTSPDNHEAVESLWREIMGWCLGRQGPVCVWVWAPTEPIKIFDAARRRFGAAASIRMVRDPQAALRDAAEGDGVAVLAVKVGEPWWIDLRAEWPSLRIFDAFGAGQPTALAIAGVKVAALPTGCRVVVAKEDAEHKVDADSRCLEVLSGWKLALASPGEPDARCIGAIPAGSLSNFAGGALQLV